MLSTLRSIWALLLGIGLIMTASGLQSSLLGVRAGREGFATEVTGLIMSGYFAGFLAGSLIVPRLMQQVGHVRVFAALASLFSTRRADPRRGDRAGDLVPDAGADWRLLGGPLHRLRELDERPQHQRIARAGASVST